MYDRVCTVVFTIGKCGTWACAVKTQTARRLYSWEQTLHPCRLLILFTLTIIISPPSYSERRPKSIIEKSNHRKENICETRSEIKINLNQFDLKGFTETKTKTKQKKKHSKSWLKFLESFYWFQRRKSNLNLCVIYAVVFFHKPEQEWVPYRTH